MTIKEIKKRIDESSIESFNKADLYKLFGIKKETDVPFEPNIIPEISFDNKLLVEHKGYSIYINPKMLTKMNAWGNLDAIKSLHIEKFNVYENIQLTDNRKIIKNFAYYVELIDFKLQKAWGFPEDKRFHNWYDIPKCTCPKIDNAENLGTEYRIINDDCPVHGTL